jgi:uncharacterized membrane protein YhaH (DUF805 family)
MDRTEGHTMSDFWWLLTCCWLIIGVINTGIAALRNHHFDGLLWQEGLVMAMFYTLLWPIQALHLLVISIHTVTGVILERIYK